METKLPQMTRRLLFVLFLLLTIGATAVQVFHRKLSEVVTSNTPIIKARVVSSAVEILPNSLVVRVRVERVEPIFLSPPESREFAYTHSTTITRSNAAGETVRVSPIRRGSGLEQNLEAGETYLFILASDPQGELIRVEPTSSLEEIQALTQR